MDDDSQSPGGDPLPNDRVAAPATNDLQHDDASRDFDRRHGADAAVRESTGARRPARSLQKRIDELVRQRADAARERDLWRERALSAAADNGGSTEGGSNEDQERYIGPDDSVAAVSDLPPELGAFADRIAEARGRYADFDRVAFDPALPVSAVMAETMMRSDHGPDIAYQLGRSPDMARHIAGLDPLSAARELGRIEAALMPAAARKVTGAPPPIRVLDGAESPRRDPDAMSYDQYKHWRSAR